MKTFLWLLTGSTLIGYQAGWMVGLGVFICFIGLARNGGQNLVTAINILQRNR